jgi:hypothetical protein
MAGSHEGGKGDVDALKRLPLRAGAGSISG